MTIQELKALIKQGGVTFKDGEPVIHHSGYQVAVLYGASVYENTDEEHEALLVAINDDIIPDGGIWLNPETNMIEVDLLTVHISNMQDAINLARKFNQKSIFDWRKLDSFYLSDSHIVTHARSEAWKEE